MRDKLKT